MKPAAAAAVLAVACMAALHAQGSGPPRTPATDADRLLSAYEHLLKDWAGLTRYGSEDSEIGPPKPGETRVVFLGDQIIEYWDKASSLFASASHLNRGINGQTTAQLLVRFRQDVVALHP